MVKRSLNAFDRVTTTRASRGHWRQIALFSMALNLLVILPSAFRSFRANQRFMQESVHTLPNEKDSVLRGTVDATTRMAKYNDVYHYQKPALPHPPALPECGPGPDYAKFFTLDPEKRSRYKEDKIVYERFFKGKHVINPTYIELGAFNGMAESNSRFFDVCLGWEGLLMEGNPQQFPHLTTNRPNAHRLEFAPSCSADYEAVNKTIPFFKSVHTNTGLLGKALAYQGGETVEVPCGPLTPVLQDILLRNGRKSIQFFSLDVEGAEPMVLKTIDFNKVPIDVLMIEVKNSFCQNDDCESRKQIRAIMHAAGFQRYENLVDSSDVYVHPQSEYQLM